MQRPRAHPPLLIGFLSLAAATLLGRLIDPDVPRDFLEGVFDSVGVAALYGYLLARHAGTLRPS